MDTIILVGGIILLIIVLALVFIIGFSLYCHRKSSKQEENILGGNKTNNELDSIIGKTIKENDSDIDIFDDDHTEVLENALNAFNEDGPNRRGSIAGGAKAFKHDPNKPAIILFNGFGSSKLFWEYAYEGKSDLRQLNFLKKLKRIGDIHTFNYPFFNVNYYTRSDLPKETKVWKTINEKYKPFDPELNFTLEDLDYKNICAKVHEEVKAKYGPSKKYIVVGHGYGGPLALLYSKLYKSECKLCVCIDNPPYVLKFYEKYNERQNKTVATKINDNKKLEKLLNTIKTSNNMSERNEAGDKVMTLISRLSALDRIKYYDPKLHVPTIFFKSLKTNPSDMERIQTRFNRKEKKQFSTDSNMKFYKFFKDAGHYIWNNQKYSDAIVRGIKKFY